MRAPRHAAIAVMALTASTNAAAQNVGIFNPDARGIIYSPGPCRQWPPSGFFRSEKRLLRGI